MSQLGEIIGIAREVKGWSVRELERQSGVSNPLISQIETGKIANPGFHTVISLCDALGITLDRLAGPYRRRLDVLRKSAARKRST